MFKKIHFPLVVMHNSVVLIQILTKIYRPQLKSVSIIKFSSIMTRTSDNRF